MLELPFAINLLGQEVVPADLAIIGLLIVLEGLLSIDNALVLGMLAKRLPKHMRARALSYGLIGAFVFRVLAIILAGVLLKYTFVKFLGGGYLVFIAVKHLYDSYFATGHEKIIIDEVGNPKLVDAVTEDTLDPDRQLAGFETRAPVTSAIAKSVGEDLVTAHDSHDGNPPVDDKKTIALFWRTVLVIELTDIAFAVDSILAAMALAGSRQEKLWVVITGGIIGVILMRFAAAMFVRLLERFPRFEVAAYLLVLAIGLKLLADWAFNSDWSFSESTWIGSWQPWFEGLEAKRVAMVHAYESWLTNTWPLGMGDHPESTIKKTEKLLDFHDFRRPECFGFWLIMVSCFVVGFLPKRRKGVPSIDS